MGDAVSTRAVTWSKSRACARSRPRPGGRRDRAGRGAAFRAPAPGWGRSRTVGRTVGLLVNGGEDARDGAWEGRDGSMRTFAPRLARVEVNDATDGCARLAGFVRGDI